MVRKVWWKNEFLQVKKVFYKSVRKVIGKIQPLLYPDSLHGDGPVNLERLIKDGRVFQLRLKYRLCVFWVRLNVGQSILVLRVLNRPNAFITPFL